MDRLNQYREILERILSQYAGIRYANADLTNETVFDRVLWVAGGTATPRHPDSCRY